MMIIKSYKRWLIICFMSILLIGSFHHIISKKIEFVTYSNGNLRIQDYAYHIIMVNSFWFDGFGNIYKPYFQQQALSAYVGSKIHAVMPLGITPIALLVWFPFAYVARFSMALSYTIWMTISIVTLINALWSFGRLFFQNRNSSILSITLSLITLFSATTFFAIILGQTSVLAAGLLIYLICLLYKKANEPTSYNFLIFSLLVFILGMKPTYIILCLGLLIIYGMWREALYSILIVFVFLIGITPLLTLGWVPSYLNLLRMYSHGEFPAFYASAIVPETMNIFRSAFRNILSDNIAGLISNFVTYSVYICVVGLSLLSKIKKKPIYQLFFSRMTREQLVVLFIASYLLFAPYAGGYEDILFLPVFITVSLYGNTPPLTNYKSITLTCILFVILLHNIFPPDKPLWLFWILKTIILGSMVIFCRYPSKKRVR